MSEKVRVCLVVPTYNERENVPRLVEEFGKVRRADEALLFVDDSSPDGTGELIRQLAVAQPWVRIYTRSEKTGIGSAYKEGFRVALSTLAPEIIVEMDADLQHPPSTVRNLVEAVDAGADVAIASRYVEGGSAPGWSAWRRLVSRVANGYARTLLGLPVRDSTSGFRAYKSEAARMIADATLPLNGFEFQVATLHLLKSRVKFVEVPYAFSTRSAGTSKLKAKDIGKFFIAVLRIAVT